MRALEQLRLPRGLPKTIKVDNGSEFISKAMDKWAYEHGVELDFSRPGKPTDNAKVESFNGRFREECLNANWFLSLEDAKGKIEAWRRYYNEDRPHSAQGWMPDIDHQAFAGVVIHEGQRPQPATIEQGISDKVHAPDIR